MPAPCLRRRVLTLECLEDRSLLDSGGMTSFSSLALNPESYRTDRILVQFRGQGVFAIAGTQVADSLGGVHEVRLTKDVSVAAALAAYQGDPPVAFAQPDYRVTMNATPNDPSFGSLWGLNNTGTSDADIDAPAAWNVTTGSGRTIVAVIDSGVDYNHPDLAANIWTNTDEIPGNRIDDDHNGYVDDIHGYDFANNDGNPMDDNGHGTHVAGTIGAVGDNGRGVTGVNWHVQIMALKFLDASGSGYVSDALRALNYAVANGATISNNSWGGGGFDQAMLTALRNARSAGHIFVAAAGNDGRDNDANASYPSSYDVDNVVSVAALDRNDNLASFSNYGARTVDIGAPGVSILSTTPNNTYSSYSGTSMAAPHVTGVIALVRDLHPDWTYRQVIDQVLSTAEPVSALRTRTVTGGRVNAAAAVGLPVTDASAPRATEAGPTVNANGSVSSVRVTFSEAIDPATFTTADVTAFTGPAGTLAATGVGVVSGSGNRQFDVTFATQATPGSYTFRIGPDIRDTAGNRLNQDGDAFFGETTQDQFTVSFVVGTTATLGSADVNKPILDFQRTISILDVQQDLAVKDLNVRVSLTHSYVGDLKICLLSPTGQKVALVKRRGGSGDNFSATTFDDQAATPIGSATAPFGGSFRPEVALNEFKNQNARGRWELWIDDLAYGDSGWLTAWSLSFSSTASSSRVRATGSVIPAPTKPRASGAELLLLTGAKKDLARHLDFG